MLNELSYQIVEISDTYPVNTEILNIEGIYYAYFHSRLTKINLQIVAQQLRLKLDIDNVHTYDTISIYAGEIVNSQQIQGIDQYLCPKDTHLMNILNDIRVNLDLSQNILNQINLFPVLFKNQPNKTKRTK